LRIHADHDFAEYAEKTFAIVQHKSRSLSTISAKRIEERDLYFIDLIRSQKQLKKKYGRLLNIFISDRYTFVALVMTTNGRRRISSSYLIKSLSSSLAVMGRKRFWGVLKNIILN
jgi:hypothetical protein